MFLLHAGAAAERNVAAAGDRVAADVRLGLHQDDRCAGLARDDRRRQSGRAGADHDDVGLLPPFGGRRNRARGHGGACRTSAGISFKVR